MKTGLYRHYKHPDHFYRVLSIALSVETQSKMVVYHAQHAIPELADDYGDRPVFVRPIEIFSETIDHDGQNVSRFEYVGD